MEYLHWKEEKITDFSAGSVAAMYDRGFVFTRKGKGVMQQTRSVRVDMSTFDLTSENRRILKKTEGVELISAALPLREEYDWSIGKLAKDFYDARFGAGIFNAAKVKEILTDESKSNFNSLLIFSKGEFVIGYSICYAGKEVLHYSYPFYDLKTAPKDMGLGMMIRAIQYAKDSHMKYIYLGSLQRPGDTYKLQFEGLEWFDGKKWQADLESAKNLVK